MTRYQFTIPHDKGRWQLNVDAMNDRDARVAALEKYNAGLTQQGLWPVASLPPGTVLRVVHP